jgi:hypothetical protein
MTTVFAPSAIILRAANWPWYLSDGTVLWMRARHVSEGEAHWQGACRCARPRFKHAGTPAPRPPAGRAASDMAAASNQVDVPQNRGRQVPWGYRNTLCPATGPLAHEDPRRAPQPPPHARSSPEKVVPLDGEGGCGGRGRHQRDLVLIHDAQGAQGGGGAHLTDHDVWELFERGGEGQEGLRFAWGGEGQEGL